MIEKLSKVRDALLEVSDNVHHYTGDSKNNTYIVWMEDGEGDSLFAENANNDMSISGTIDLFTKAEYDILCERIPETLSKNDICWKLNSVQYEEETKLIHYEWIFEVV
ncbi:MAG: hypothetical protein RR531_13535 [Longicatena sp.]